MKFEYTLVKQTNGYQLSTNGNEHQCTTHDAACNIIYQQATHRIYALLDQYYALVLKNIHATDQEQWRAISDKYKQYAAKQYPFYMIKDQMTVPRLTRLLPVLPTPRTEAQSILNQIDQLYTYMDEKTDHRQSIAIETTDLVNAA